MNVLGLLFLSSDELRDLTDLRIPKAQMRWLQKNAIPFAVSAAGKPKVLRTYVIEKLQITTGTAKSNEPNFDAIR